MFLFHQKTHLHQHTVLVPEQVVHTSWWAGLPLFGFISRYFLPLLIGAILRKNLVSIFQF